MRASWSLLVVPAALTGCASFAPVPMDEVPFKTRLQTQAERDVIVAAVVLGPDETEAVFGAPLYRRGIQPIWLEITNNDDMPVWYLHVGTDPEYFPPLEVAYMHRSGLSADGEREMQRFYHDNAIGKFVPPGTTRSGFVFTNLELGTKDFNVDLVGEDDDIRTLTFFCPVPGFRMDHADVDWDALYADDQIVEHDDDGLRHALASLPKYTTAADGTGEGEPLNVVIVGHAQDAYHAFIRAGWEETGSLDVSDGSSTFTTDQRRRYAPARPYYAFGRRQDVALRKSRKNVRERNELRVWLTPFTVNGEPVWLGQVRRSIGEGLDFNLQYKIDADMDEARTYLLQDLWYAHKLRRIGYVMNLEPSSISAPRRNLVGNAFFTDGARIVLWISDTPVPFEDTEYMEWDDPPLRGDR